MLVLTARPALTDRSGEAKALDTVGDHDFLRSWHWVNRFVTALAEQDGLRRSMWLLARQRIADVLGAPWDGPVGTPTVPDLPAGDKTRRARIGDLVTSERGVALLLAWHQADPAGVVGPGPDTEMPAGGAREAACERRPARGVRRGEGLGGSRLHRPDDRVG